MHFQLPEGYSYDAPEGHDFGPLLGATGVNGEALYGGATISSETDAGGNVYVGCCAKGPDGQFGFRVFRAPAGNDTFVEVPLPEFATGRGTVNDNRYDGLIHYTAWADKGMFVMHPVPGCMPFTQTGGGQPTPTPTPTPAGPVEDDTARQQIQALVKVVQALGSKNGIQDQRLDALGPAVAALQARPVGLTPADLDTIWTKAGDRLLSDLDNPASPPSVLLVAQMHEVSQQVLLAAIDYAISHTAQQSHLRALIEQIVTAALAGH